MSNTASYLNPNDKTKLKRIAEKTQSSESKVIQCVIRYMPEDYLCDLVNNYIQDLNK